MKVPVWYLTPASRAYLLKVSADHRKMIATRRRMREAEINRISSNKSRPDFVESKSTTFASLFS